MRAKHMVAETGNNEVIDDLNELIEQIWNDLDGKVPQTRIHQVATGVAAKFRNAPVTTNIPLFIRHLTREWLKGELASHDLNG